MEPGSAAKNEGDKSQFKLASKLLSYQLVNSTVEKGRKMYELQKTRNESVGRALNAVENSLSMAIAAAVPYVAKYDSQIRKIDAVACEKLNAIEKYVPELTAKLPNVSDAKRLIGNGQRGALDMYDRTLKPKVDGVRRLVDSTYSNLLDALDLYVDRWLPGEANVAKKGEEAERLSARALTSKMANRASNVAAQRLGAIRSRSADSLERARRGGLILVDTARRTYDELSKAVRVEFESERRSATVENAETPIESPSRLSDTITLGRAFVKVGSRYTSAILNEAPYRTIVSEVMAVANNTAKLLPAYIPLVRVTLRVEEVTDTPHKESEQHVLSR